MRFTGKVCVVTGGANGIGRCIAEKFFASGARIACLDRDETAVRQMASRLGQQHLIMAGDAAEKETLVRFAAQVLERFGTVDALINNACVSLGGLLSGCSYEDFVSVLRLGVAAPYYLSRLFLEHFAEGAAIVNIASTRAFMSQPDTESYSAAKGGVCALTHALSVSLAGKVRVNAVSPGWIDTRQYNGSGTAAAAAGEPGRADREQHPAGRIGRPEDVAALVLFLCGPEAGFVTGQNMVVDGGMTRQMIYHAEHGWTFTPEP